MNENEIKELIERLLEEVPRDELAANIADRWHEAVMITKKETYAIGHTEGYRDGVRDGRNECRGTDTG